MFAAQHFQQIVFLENCPVYYLIERRGQVLRRQRGSGSNGEREYYGDSLHLWKPHESAKTICTMPFISTGLPARVPG